MTPKNERCNQCAAPIRVGEGLCRACWERNRALADERHPRALIEAERPTK